MSDILRVVTLSAGGRPVVVQDLENGSTFAKERGSFAVAPGNRKQQQAGPSRRYAGQRATGEVQDNATVQWSSLVSGANVADQTCANADLMLAVFENWALGMLIEFRPDGASRSTFYDVRGPASWTPKYNWAQFAGARSISVDVQVPVAPLALWAPCDILDDFSVDTIGGGDWLFDAGVATDVTVTGGALTPTGTLTTERRLTHTARGYTELEAQGTLKATPGATITGFKAGGTLRRSASNTYVDVYVDDNGTNSRLQIDVVIAGTRTNRSLTNLAARVANGTAFWVRRRIEGQTVIAEYFTSAPTPMATPTTTASYTLTAGEQTSLVAGRGGLTWIPQASGAAIDDYEYLPRTYRNQTIPVVLQMLDQVPGSAPALMDVTVTPSGGTAPPVWGMIAWTKRATTPVSGAVAPFGIIPAENGTSLSGWAVSADATYRGGSGLKVTTSGAGTFTASYGIDPSTLPADAFTDKELRIEVWARVDLASTLVTPTLKVTVQPGAGTSFGAERTTPEWGTAGKQLTKPSSGSVKRQVLLGTLPLITDAALKWNLVLTGTVLAGSTGTFGVDELYLVCKRQRALQATSKVNDATFPKFVASTSETSKTIRSQLQGRVAQPPNASYPDAGMGGTVMEPPAGPVDVFVELSSLVPDDPTSDATSEQLSHSATIHVAVTPRIFLFRGT